MHDYYWLKRLFFILAAYLLYLWTWQTAFAIEPEARPTVLSLKGHLSKEELQAASQSLKGIAITNPLIIILNSNSGDLPQALELSKAIYELKNESHLFVIVYIEDNAVGPAAIFPFLADSLYVSNFISWGDIPFGNEKIFASNVLRNRVTNLINGQQRNANVLRLIASAMIDPSTQAAESAGNEDWRGVKDGGQSAFPFLPVKGQTLIVNHAQIRELGLVKEILTKEQFDDLYPSIKNNPSSTSSSTSEEVNRAIAFAAKLKKHILFNPSGPNVIGRIIIEDHSTAITQATWLYVKAALDHYKKIKPAFVILELNTPGGEVFAAQKISDALKELDTQFNIPVVAYINNWAISAGAMLAYSCRFVVTAKDGSMGAAEPVLEGAEGKMETASEKINSALRADFANRARFFDRDPLIAEAMVDKDLIIVLRYGQVVKLTNENQIRSEGINPDVIISSKGKLLTLDAQEMIALGVADLMLPPTKTPLMTSEELEGGKWPAVKNPIFHQSFFDAIPEATIETYQMDWKMQFFALLASPAVSSLLMLGLMLGFYLEITTPGFGLPGTLAVTCLFLIMLSSFSLEIANWLEVILLFTGLAVILIEILVLPTFGLLGFIGVVFFFIGLFGMMLPGVSSLSFDYQTQTFNAAGSVFVERLVWLSGTLVIALILILLLARFVTPKLAGFSRLVLKGNEQVGYTSVDHLSELPKTGSFGRAATMLRPAGKVIIADIQYDAMSIGSYIEKGEAIVVKGIDGGTLLVAESEKERNRE